MPRCTSGSPRPAAAGGAAEGDGGHRDAAARGHRRHHPLLAHRRSGGRSTGGPAAARGAGAARAQERRSDRLPSWAGRGRRDRRRQPGDEGVRRPQAAPAGGGDGLRRQRARRGAEADLGIAAGNKRGHLFVKGRNVAVVQEAEMVEELVEWAEFINEHGIEAAMRAPTPPRPSARPRGPRQAARRQGPRRQPPDEKIVEIRRTVNRTEQGCLTPPVRGRWRRGPRHRRDRDVRHRGRGSRWRPREVTTSS